ncbi:hypothetical protein CSC67_07580 [Pusillimonas caeni]|uniref:KfrB domain-containing protein n=1 Tax=Pusillimonas caeni TaxID=1348472 RepID=UPI000E59C7E4|nr:hypothetical protein [Pusillimonas caeni]TFL14024.1 hypothetical protein CSC67_07580 [Pusillimonas caeni]
MGIKDLAATISKFWLRPSRDTSHLEQSSPSTVSSLSSQQSLDKNEPLGREIAPFGGPEDHFERLVANWSGTSVRDLVDSNYQLICDLYPKELMSERLQLTVPDEYRGEVYAAKSEHPNAVIAMSNSLASITRGASIIAIDESGEALVNLYTCFDYEDAEDMNYKFMPREEAFELIDNYRLSHAISGFEQRLLPADFDYASLSRPLEHVDLAQYLDGEFEKLQSVPGQTYRGVIVEASNGTLVQDIGAAYRVAHDDARLVGLGPDSLVGREVEIRYSHGQIGIVQEVHESLGHHMKGPDRNEYGL